MNTIVTNQPKGGVMPSLKFQKPQTFVLANGLKVLVVANHKLPRVTFQLQIDHPLFTEGDKKGVDSLTSALLGKGSLNITKEAFFEEIDFLGLEMQFHASGAKAEGLSKYAGRILELFAEGCLHPNFTQEELDKERNKLIEALRSNEKNVQHTLARIENSVTFGENHPKGEFTTEATLNCVTLADVIANYQNYFNPQQAYLVIIGDVNFETVQTKVTALFSNWKANPYPTTTYDVPPTVAQTQITWVNMDHAVQTDISVVNTMDLPMNDPDYFPVVIANQILGGGADGRLFLNLREKHGWTYGSYSTIGAGKYTQKFKASAQVRHNVVGDAILEILKEIKLLRTTLVSEADLQLAKSKYIGNFIMQSQKPEAIARYALHTEIQNLPFDFYENYIENMNRVSAEDVLRVAQHYFLADNCHVFAVGKGTAIRSELEKTGITTVVVDNFGESI